MPAVAVGCALLAVAGCNPSDVEVATRQVPEVLKVTHGIHIPGSEVAKLADRAAVSAGTLGDTAQRLGETHPWQAIREQLQNMNETARTVVVETACQMLLQQRLGMPVDAEGDLIRNAAAVGLPPNKEFLDAANDAYKVLYDDEASVDETNKAAVSAGCYVTDQAFKFMVH